MTTDRNDNGFTLIELLVVVTVIGVLLTIAIPEFNSYRQRTYDAAAFSDLKNFKSAMEAYSLDNQLYPTF
jgi:type IV pilus assembly protein PilA